LGEDRENHLKAYSKHGSGANISSYFRQIQCRSIGGGGGGGGDL